MSAATKLYLIVMVPLILLHGFTVMTIWNWFIEPLGAPEIGIATAIGLSILAGLLRGSETDSTDGTLEAALALIFTAITKCAFALGIGGLVVWLS